MKVTKFLFISMYMSLTTLLNAAPKLEIKDPYVRGMPPGAPNTAAYFELTNKGTTPLVLVGAHTEVARKVELHDTVMDDQMMSMKAVPKLTLGPGETKKLESGGLHLMLLQVQSLDENTEILIELEFDDGISIPIIFPVRSVKKETQRNDHR
jgi:copper(I)-binding protein